MATEVKVPSMGESITSGILSAWLVKDGDFVEKDQPIYELETDKITSEATAEVSGIIQFKVEQDAEVDIGATVAIIDDSAKAPTSNDAPKACEVKEPVIESSAKTSIEPTKEAIVEKPQEPEHSEKVLSPASLKHSIETQVDINQVQGTGKDGRITKGDILSAKATNDSPEKETKAAQLDSLVNSTPSTSSDSSTRETRKKMSPLRKKIAQRLVNATQEAALLTTFNEVDMSRVMQLRKTHQESFVKRYGIKLGFMSFFTKAVVNALQSVPAVNARIEGKLPLIEKRNIPKEEAIAEGAMSLFGEKYGDTVRSIRFGQSIELCGGTHVQNTGDLWHFKITSEGAVAAGVRRIEAITTEAVKSFYFDNNRQFFEMKGLLNNSKEPVKVLKSLQDENAALKKQIEQLLKDKTTHLKNELKNQLEEIDGIQFLAIQVDLDAGGIKNLAFELGNEFNRLFLLFGTNIRGKAILTCYISKGIVSDKLHAGTIVRELGKYIHGGGGGQPFFATAGGKNPEGIQQALTAAKNYLQR